MKKVTKIMVAAMLLVLSISTMYSQTFEWKNPPTSSEKIIGKVSSRYVAGRRIECKKVLGGTHVEDTRENVSDIKLYEYLLNIAKTKYGKEHPKFTLRSFSSNCKETTETRDICKFYDRYYYIEATVVTPDDSDLIFEDLPKAVDKALNRVPEGSKIALDQLTITIDTDKEVIKDKLLDLLLDKGYGVVAKEYLERLYKEQQDQLSGIYNERTTVQENNFSAVGYFINLKITENIIRVQVVNVSTGEYVGNATVNF